MFPQNMIRQNRELERAFRALPPSLRGHSERVSFYTEVLLRRAYAENIYPQNKSLSPSRISLAGYATRFHDIGLSRIPARAFSHPDFPEKDMHWHPALGAEMIRSSVPDVQMQPPSSAFLWQIAAVIASEHHECWNGQGYPRGLCGEQINVYARACSIADAYDTRILLLAQRAGSHAALFQNLAHSPEFDPALLSILLQCEPLFRYSRELYRRLSRP